MHQLTDWLPTTRKEMDLRGWDQADVILFSGDAYVDHPSFPAAVIGRLLEDEGLRVAIVPQPDWHGDFRDFKRLGRPRLWFGIAPGDTLLILGEADTGLIVSSPEVLNNLANQILNTVKNED